MYILVKIHTYCCFFHLRVEGKTMGLWSAPYQNSFDHNNIPWLVELKLKYIYLCHNSFQRQRYYLNSAGMNAVHAYMAALFCTDSSEAWALDCKIANTFFFYDSCRDMNDKSAYTQRACWLLEVRNILMQRYHQRAQKLIWCFCHQQQSTITLHKAHVCTITFKRAEMMKMLPRYRSWSQW